LFKIAKKEVEMKQEEKDIFEEIIETIKESLSITGPKDIREKIFRVLRLCLFIREEPNYFHLYLDILEKMEDLVRARYREVNIDDYDNLINSPFAFTHLSEEQAAKVDECLREIFKDDSLEQRLLKESEVSACYQLPFILILVKKLLESREVIEGFNFFVANDLSEETLYEWIVAFYKNKGYTVDYEKGGSIICEKKEDVINVVTLFHPSAVSMIIVYH